jgi:hypothetical protein
VPGVCIGSASATGGTWGTCQVLRLHRRYDPVVQSNSGTKSRDVCQLYVQAVLSQHKTSMSVKPLP